MKKNFVKCISALVVMLFVTSPLMAEDAVVTYVKGKVEVLKNNTWVALNVGDTLKQSDTVSTGFQSEAKLKYNGSLLSLGALTRITMDQLSSSGKSDKVDVYLSTGAVRAKVTHSEDERVDFSLRTSVAVASVRGTEFTMTDKGSVTCFEGAVAVYPNTEGRKIASADEAVEETEEEAEEESDETEAPAGTVGEGTEAPEDNGPATPTTPPEEINANAPTDAVVVGANQKTTITKTGTPEKPADTAKKTANKVKSAAQTAASKEAVSATGGSSTVTPEATDNGNKKGSIKVQVEFED